MRTARGPSPKHSRRPPIAPEPRHEGAMAVGIRIKLAGVTAEQFDRLEAAVDPDGSPPDGLIFHASGPIDDGWGVLDFWQSRAQFDRFAAERIGPAVQA